MELKTNKLPFAFMKTKYEDASKYTLTALYIIAGYAIILSLFNGPSGIAYTIKIIVNIVISIIVAKETEILYLTHNNNIYRKEALEITKTTKPIITGLILALILPVGTPIYIVAIAAFISIFIGKMVFGGFSYNPFNPALIGKLFVSISWGTIVNNEFSSGIFNYILTTVFKLPITSEITTLNYITGFNIDENIGDVGLIVLALVFVYLAIKKVVNINTTITILTTIFLITFIITKDIEVSLLAVLSNSVLFSAIFLVNDPVTTPYSNYGKIVYAIICALTATVILQLGNATTAIFYAILFANLFVPLINSNMLKIKFAKNKQTIKLIVITIIAIVVTTYLIMITQDTVTASSIGGIL